MHQNLHKILHKTVLSYLPSFYAKIDRFTPAWVSISTICDSNRNQTTTHIKIGYFYHIYDTKFCLESDLSCNKLYAQNLPFFGFSGEFNYIVLYLSHITKL